MRLIYFLIILTIFNFGLCNTCEVSYDQYCCGNNCLKCQYCFKNNDDFQYYIHNNPHAFNYIEPIKPVTNVPTMASTGSSTNTTNSSTNIPTDSTTDAPTDTKKRQASNNTNTSFPIIYLGCCVEYIDYRNVSCSNTTIELCTNETMRKENDLDKIIKFFKSGPIWGIVLASIGIAVFGLFLLYTCCCFGKKKPPLDYDLIIAKLDNDKIFKPIEHEII